MDIKVGDTVEMMGCLNNSNCHGMTGTVLEFCLDSEEYGPYILINNSRGANFICRDHSLILVKSSLHRTLRDVRELFNQTRFKIGDKVVVQNCLYTGEIPTNNCSGVIVKLRYRDEDGCFAEVHLSGGRIAECLLDNLVLLRN